GLAVAAPASAGTAAKPKNITVSSHLVSFKFLPSKTLKGQAKEDMLVKGKKIGHDLFTWTKVNSSKNTAVATYTFSNGAVNASGSYSTAGSHPIVMTITGGSGAYSGAHGKATRIETSETTSNVTFAFS